MRFLKGQKGIQYPEPIIVQLELGAYPFRLLKKPKSMYETSKEKKYCFVSEYNGVLKIIFLLSLRRHIAAIGKMTYKGVG